MSDAVVPSEPENESDDRSLSEIDDLLDIGLARAFDEAPSPLSAEFASDSDSSVDTGLDGEPWVTLPEPEARRTELGDALSALVDELETSRRYRILGELGRGGMGVVLAARDLRLGREVAIKILHESPSHSSRRVRRFVEEAQIAGQLQHPGIVPVYDIGVIGETRPYFSMKYVRGVTMGEWLSERDRGASITLGVFQRVCEAMAYAHARGVIHRDLKPANIMIGRFGEVLVMDWGIAKVAGAPQPGSSDTMAGLRTSRDRDDAMQSQSGAIMGTPCYMAPEQARGEVRELDARTDVFALGAILYQMLVGRAPWDRVAMREVRNRAATGALEPLYRGLDRSPAPRELVELAKECLAVEPQERPVDAQAVVERIAGYRGALNERARRAEIDSVQARARAEQERRVQRLTVGLVVAVAVAIVGGVAVWAGMERREQSLVRQEDEERADTRAEVQAMTERARELYRMARDINSDTAWDEALTASAAALATASSTEVEDSLLRSVQALSDEMRIAKRSADQRMRGAERIRRLRSELSRAYMLGQDPSMRDEALVSYKKAFDAFGEDPLSDDPCPTLRDPSLRESLSAALHQWALVLYATKRSERDWRRLADRALEIDDDPVRGQLFRALMTKDNKLIKRLVESVTTRGLSPVTLVMVGRRIAAELGNDAAFKFFIEHARRHPGDEALNADAGYFALQVKPARVALAMRHFSAAVAAAPQRYLHSANFGVAILESGDPKGAIIELRRARRIDFEHWFARYHLGRALARDGKHDEALHELESAIQDRPKNWALRLAHAKVLTSVSRREEAHEAYRIGRELGARPLSSILLSMAKLSSAVGETERAREEFEQALGAEPGLKEQSSIWMGLGRLAERRGESSEALEAYGKAAKAYQGNSAIYYNWGNVLMRGRRLDEAIVKYRQALRVYPEYAKAWINLAQCLRSRGRYDEALDAYVSARGILKKTGGKAPFDLSSPEADCRTGKARLASLRAVMEGRRRIRDIADFRVLLKEQRRQAGRFGELKLTGLALEALDFAGSRAALLVRLAQLVDELFLEDFEWSSEVAKHWRMRALQSLDEAASRGASIRELDELRESLSIE